MRTKTLPVTKTTFRFMLHNPDRYTEADVVVARSKKEWEQRQEFWQPHWNVRVLDDGRVIAVKLQ
jgi:hypothetical protein